MNVVKTFSILHEYEGSDQLQLLVTIDRGGDQSISPQDPKRTAYMLPYHRSEGLNIIAVLWGNMSTGPKEVPSSVVEKIKSGAPFSCTNDFFGFDLEFGVQKTAQVFYRYGNKGKVLCASAKEGETCTLKGRPSHEVLARMLAANADWARGIESAHPGFFKKLAEGQSPQVRSGISSWLLMC